ncbi:MAG: GreA/GreB family elongation factor [Myxococcales bacterium]|nr:GreA/GreB family elongation factor [Myxococcales bacterium]
MASRADLKRALLAAAEAALATARAAHAAAVEGATHAEARAENDKDTRGLEQSYLARGHAARVQEIEAALPALAALSVGRAPSQVALGAIVTVDDDGATVRYYLAPWGGGVTVGGDVAVVTPQSPIGRALLGRAAGDLVEIRRPGGVREVEVTRID